MLKEQEDLVTILTSVIKEKKLKTKRNVVKEILNNLRVNNIEDAIDWINQPEEYLGKLNTRELYLFTEQVYEITESESIKPDEWFTSTEIKKAATYSGKETIEEIKLPLTLENFIQLSHNTFIGKISGDKLAQLVTSQLLHYNFDVQREHGYTKTIDGVKRKVKLITQNVLEIKDNLRTNSQMPTQIVINAQLGSAEGNEDEIIYDSVEKRLTITRQTILDVIDGWHRTKATEMVYMEDGHVNFDWILLLTNYSQEEAKIYQGQLALATPIAKERRDMLLQKRKSDLVVNDLMANSELKDRVSVSKDVHGTSKELVAYKVLAEAIDSEFKIEKNIDVYKISAFLKKYFDILMGTYEDEFLNNPQEYRKTSLINHNNMFFAYIILAAKLFYSDKDPSEIIGIMEKINFSRDNEEFIQYGIIDPKGRITDTPKARKAIKKYFENLVI